MKSLSQFFYVLTITVAIPFATQGQSYTWATIAGLASASGSNDGVGNSARFSVPLGLAATSDGNVYVADSANNTVRELSPSGTNWVVSTIAGGGGNFNVQGSGTQASFQTPTAIVAFNPTKLYALSGILRIMSLNNGVWQVTSPSVKPIGGFSAPSAMNIDGAGNIYVTDSGDNTLDLLTPQSQGYASIAIAGDGSRGTAGTADGTNGVSRFDAPTGVAVDGSGNVYVADTVNDSIREISPVPFTTNWITATIAGHVGLAGLLDGTNTASYFSSPDALAVDATGALYVADEDNNAIRKLALQGGNWIVTTIGGLPNRAAGSADGFGLSASFLHPGGIAVDNQGRIFVADTGNNTIRMGTASVPVTNTAPVLQLATGGGGAAVIWPTSLSGYILESSTNGSVGPWSAVTNGITTNFVFSARLTNSLQLFRLRQQ